MATGVSALAIPFVMFVSAVWWMIASGLKTTDLIDSLEKFCKFVNDQYSIVPYKYYSSELRIDFLAVLLITTA